MASEGYFLAGHPALDFVNTLAAPQGVPVDFIPDGLALLQWMLRAELISPAIARASKRWPVDQLDEIATKARALRNELRHALPFQFSEKPPRRLITVLNRILAVGTLYRKIECCEGHISLLDSWRIENPNQLLAPIAESIADLLAHVDPAAIKSCENKSCILWFVDHTHGRRRRFCSAAICGNRHKVAEFRARKKAMLEPDEQHDD